MRITVILTNEEHRELKRRAGAVPVSRWLRLLGLGGELPLTIENAIAVAKEIPASAEGKSERTLKRQKISKRTPPSNMDIPLAPAPPLDLAGSGYPRGLSASEVVGLTETSVEVEQTPKGFRKKPRGTRSPGGKKRCGYNWPKNSTKCPQCHEVHTYV